MAQHGAKFWFCWGAGIQASIPAGIGNPRQRQVRKWLARYARDWRRWHKRDRGPPRPCVPIDMGDAVLNTRRSR